MVTPDGSTFFTISGMDTAEADADGAAGCCVQTVAASNRLPAMHVASTGRHRRERRRMEKFMERGVLLSMSY